MMGGVIAIIILVGCVLVLLMGCVLAFRGGRDWTTIAMLCGGVVVSLGLTVGASGVFLMQRYVRTAVVGSTTSFDVERYQTILAIGGWMLLLGFLVFVGGFVGFFGRYGAAQRRTAELEGMVQALQERMEERS